MWHWLYGATWLLGLQLLAVYLCRDWDGYWPWRPPR